MRSADQIITRNVLREIERISKAETENGRDFDLNVLAARVVEFTGWKLDSVKTQLKRFLDPKKPSVWRIDYVEAVARSLGRDVSWMVQAHESPGVREATPAQVLIGAVSARLDQQEIRLLARLLNRLLDNRPIYDLALEVDESLLEHASAVEAAARAFEIVRASAASSRRPRNLRSKRRNDKKS